MMHCPGYIQLESSVDYLSIDLRNFFSIQIFAQEKRFIESDILRRSQVFSCNIGCWFITNNLSTSILCSFELVFCQN